MTLAVTPYAMLIIYKLNKNPNLTWQRPTQWFRQRPTQWFRVQFSQMWLAIVFAKWAIAHHWFWKMCYCILSLHIMPEVLNKKYERISKSCSEECLWATSCHFQQNGMCAQQRLGSAWASAQSDQSLRYPHEETLGPYLPTERTAKTHDQTDLSLRWAHSHFVGFVIRRLICKWCAGGNLWSRVINGRQTNTICYQHSLTN